MFSVHNDDRCKLGSRGENCQYGDSFSRVSLGLNLVFYSKHGLIHHQHYYFISLISSNYNKEHVSVKKLLDLLQLLSYE